ncbi:hypothetical protein KAK07_09920 [Ideonella sp. 4Y16]|uniref:Carboxypeptidase regulatory-like domain-containing protein n=1 Tax=Ideonella alba TaxID=2824118 RepID=A0A941BGJ0_9BURK|nr:hypothetical protein [Ideonella alba]MBQ0932147.1 hypothetical protein [Ideonella alba]MBQ0943653.1 hypothetical protein [Ideonella alba]
MRTRTALLAVALLALQACGGGGREPTDGGCLNLYLEPIVLLDRVSVEGETGTISRVVIADVQLDGQPVSLQQIAVSSGIEETAQGLVCNLPCGLGNTEGTYTLQLTASGFAPRAVTVTARYAVFQGGCPSSNDGGTHVSAVMKRL